MASPTGTKPKNGQPNYIHLRRSAHQLRPSRRNPCSQYYLSGALHLEPTHLTNSNCLNLQPVTLWKEVKAKRICRSCVCNSGSQTWLTADGGKPLTGYSRDLILGRFNNIRRHIPISKSRGRQKSNTNIMPITYLLLVLRVYTI